MTRALVARVFGALAAIAIAAMVLLTVADVAMRGLFNRPIHGTYELIELLLACAVFLALPAAFLRDEHVVVDIVDEVAPRTVPLLKRLAGAVSIVVLALLGWQAAIAAKDSVTLGDVTMDLALPRILYWIPLLVGVCCAAIAALVMLLRRDR